MKVDGELADTHNTLEKHERNEAMSHLIGETGQPRQHNATNGELLFGVR
jgi:hypothetical protein